MRSYIEGGLKMDWRDIYIEDIRAVSPMAGLKWRERLNGGVLNWRVHCINNMTGC